MNSEKQTFASNHMYCDIKIYVVTMSLIVKPDTISICISCGQSIFCLGSPLQHFHFSKPTPATTQLLGRSANKMESERMSHSRTGMAERVLMVWMWAHGASPRDISSRTKTSASTVYRWLRRWQEEGTLETRQYCGQLHSRPPWQGGPPAHQQQQPTTVLLPQEAHAGLYSSRHLNALNKMCCCENTLNRYFPSYYEAVHQKYH